MGGNLLGDLVQEEVRRRERVVAIDDEAVLMAPSARGSPFQLMLAPRLPRARFEDDGPTGAALSTTAAAAGATTAVGDERFAAPSEVRAAHFSMYLGNDQNAISKYIAAYDPNSGLNAVELDIKNENGDIGFTEDMPSLAIKSGSANDIYEPRVPSTSSTPAGFYVIGRVVSFEDDRSRRTRRSARSAHRRRRCGRTSRARAG